MSPFRNPYRIIFTWLFLLALLSGLSLKRMIASPPESSQHVSFNRDVRPILSDLCFTSASEMVRRMLSHEDHERMPPPKSNRQPKKDQIETIKRWIDQGAIWEEHWSFMPLVKPAIPVLDIWNPKPGSTLAPSANP